MVHVTSEIGRLRRVLVHEPGEEVDRMVPSMMEELLFDDILFGDRARDEHAMFRRVLQLLDIEIVEAADLLEESLESGEARALLFDVLIPDLPRELRDSLEGLPADELAAALVRGVLPEPPPVTGVDSEDLFRLAPLPNWCFQRDPQVVLRDGVVFASMAAPARHREALLARLAFRFHPDLREVPVLLDPLAMRGDNPLFVDPEAPRLEGGDVLVLSSEVVAVGHSERTNRSAIQHMVRALARRDDGPRWIVVVEVPKRRAYMHLDTLITPVDRDACLVYPPVILPERRETARVYAFDLHDPDPAPVEQPDLLSALRARGLDFEPIPCGGPDPVTQQREQWTDGANALAVAPGVVTLYDRNLATAEELDRRGFRTVRAEDLLLGRDEVDLEVSARVSILLESHEMSRARGGPHCLSHPIVRDDPD